MSYLLEKFSVPTEPRRTPSAHLSLCLRGAMFTCSCASKSVLAYMSTSSQPQTLSPCFPLCERTWYLVKVGHSDKTSNWAGFTCVLLTWTNQTSGHSSGVSAAGEFYSEWEWNVTGGTCLRNETGCDRVCDLWPVCFHMHRQLADTRGGKILKHDIRLLLTSLMT